jgi:hypothetical protein
MKPGVIDNFLNVAGHFIFIAGIRVNDIPFGSFSHRHSSFRVLRAEKQFCDQTEKVIDQADENRRNYHRHNDNAGVVDHLSSIGPDDLFDLTVNVLEEALQSRDERRLFRGIFICHGSSFLSSFRLSVERVLPAEFAIFLLFDSVRIVLFVFHGVVVALLALRAGEHDLDSHCGTS